MSRREDYPAGVPCFVDTLTADLDTAMGFYGGIFGWEFAGPGAMPGDPPGDYYVARLHGDDVAGLGTLPASGAAPTPPAWNTHVAVNSVGETADRTRAAGGTVLVEPFGVPPAGRMAVIADPAGAAFVAWEAGDRAGAARVNEPSAWSMSLLATPAPAVRLAGRGVRPVAVALPPTGLCRRRAVPAGPAGRRGRDGRRRRARDLERRLLDRGCRGRGGGRGGAGRHRRCRAVRGGDIPPRGPGGAGRGHVQRQPASAQRLSTRCASDNRQHSAAVTADTTSTDGHAPIT